MPMTIRGTGVLHPKNVAIGSAPAVKSRPLRKQKMLFARSVLRSKRRERLCEVAGVVAIAENLSREWLPLFRCAQHRAGMTARSTQIAAKHCQFSLNSGFFWQSFSQITCDQFRRGRLPVVQRALGHGVTEPCERLLACLIAVNMLDATAIGLQTNDAGEVQRVVVPPFSRCAEIPLAMWFQACDTLEQHGFECNRTSERIVLGP